MKREKLMPEEGYVYHIKDTYFDFVKDEKLMRNKEGGQTRPTYCCIRKSGSELIWFIPMSTRIEKYKAIVNKNIERYGRCDSVIIANYSGYEVAFLLQNMFPVTEKYISHIHTVRGKPLKVSTEAIREVKSKVKKIFELKSRGIKTIFPDVDKITKKLLSERD